MKVHGIYGAAFVRLGELLIRIVADSAATFKSLSNQLAGAKSEIRTLKREIERLQGSRLDEAER